MADYELNETNVNINYMNDAAGNPNTAMGLFLNGGTAGGKSYPKVDMSLWDQATMCGTCHVGGAFYEKDRLGVRLPQRLFADWGAAMTGSDVPNINPLTTTVWENYSSTTGKDKSFVTYSPWAYPVFVGNNPANAAVIPPSGLGWGPDHANGQSAGTGIDMKDPNTGMTVHVSAGQLMMPNVKEMDCLFCHLKGYDNVMASVATQAGSLSTAPMIGAGLMDMFPVSPSYQGYNGQNVVFGTNTSAAGPGSHMQTVTLSDATVARILAQPDDNNCMQCHATKTLKDFPEMFGVTGNSSGFLSSAPMVYDPLGTPFGPLGKRMVSYDINSPFMQSGTSPVIDGNNAMSFMMPGLNYLQAMGPSNYNGLTAGQLGGGNAAMTGPLYYSNTAGLKDQNTLKRSTMPFPRAEWFKRGDAWQIGQDVHSTVGCAGCHFTGNSTDKNQCDPGRGFDMASTTADGVPHFKDRAPDLEGGTVATAIKKHDTRNTVKRCEFCHITHTDYQGNPIDTFGAPDPTVGHQNAGLLANITQIVDQQSNHGTYGGKGVATMTNFTTQQTKLVAGGTILGRGNHLDVMDCTVCHVQKISMAVRSLDASSGMRFPAIVGTDPRKGMLGLFEDPTGMGAAATGMGGSLQEWKPLHLWQALGNSEEPLSTSYNSAEIAPADSRIKFRRKIYLSNAITAILWNNEDPNVDANGDGANGGLLIGDDPATLVARTDLSTKPSLVGYRDIFSGDVPDRNNTAAFGIPIFDPWIQHDLKAGINFGPGPLSVISVGFGGFGTPAGTTDPSGGVYQSLYDTNGYFANNNWKYASVWSGAVVFTEPDQISNYKAYRTAIKGAGDGKSWDKTVLTLVGAPFMVTHGVKGISTFVQGKSTTANGLNGCTDCHAANKGFFNGSFDMVGPAIPTSTTYDPAHYPVQNADGSLQIDPATGDPALNTGTSAVLPPSMMARPLERVRIKAKKGDLRGYLETHNKLGQPREVDFVKDTTDALYSYASDIQRSEALYPDEDGAIYFKISDIKTDGHLNTGAVALKGSDYATYMETGVSTNLADYGIGVAPKAVINLTTLTKVVATGKSVFSTYSSINSPPHAMLAKPNAGGTEDIGTVTYAWSTSDSGATITNPNSRTDVNITFPTIGSKTITLKVTDGQGISNTTYVNVTAILPPASITWLETSVVGLKKTGTATFANLPAGTTQMKIYWGDGALTTKTSGVSDPLDLAHTYSTSTSKIIQLICYSALGKQLGSVQQAITP